jgi:hypothetical protein
MEESILTIQGRPGQAVYLTGFRFNVNRKHPIRGVMVGPPCGGPITGRYIEADLDQVPPHIIESSSNPKATVGEVPNNYQPLTLPYEISSTDRLLLLVQGTSGKYEDVWSMDILWSSNGINGDTRINDNGVPFKTSPSRYRTKLLWCIGCKGPG